MARRLELTAPRQARFTQIDIKEPGENEIVLEAVLSAVSHGTELSLYRGTSPFAHRSFDMEKRLFIDGGNSYPQAMGYEWVGRVVGVGDGVRIFHEGNLLHLPLPHAEGHICRMDQLNAWGVRAPLPDSVTPESACFLSLISIALQAVHDARIISGDRVAIFGMGVLGLLTVKLIRLSGAGQIVAVEPDPSRRALALEWGADSSLHPEEKPAERIREESPGADVAIDFSGRDSALHQAVRSLRAGGLCVAAGFYQGGAANLVLGEEWLHNRITMVASSRGWGNAHRCFPRWDRARLHEWAVELLARKTIAPESLITEFRDYTEAPEVYAELDNAPNRSLKTVFRYQRASGAVK